MYSTPDAALRRWFALRRRLERPKPVTGLEPERRMVPFENCVRCFSSEWRFGGADEAIEKCVECGSTRRYREGIMLASEVQRSRSPSSSSIPLEELATLTIAFSRLSKWQLRVWVAYSIEEVGSLEDAAQSCRARWPKHNRRWTRRYVTALVQGARAEIASRFCA